MTSYVPRNHQCVPYRKEIDTVRAQHPFEDLQYLKPSLRMTYAGARCAWIGVIDMAG